MILLDTHVLIWYLAEPEKLSVASSERLSAGFGEEGVGISDIRRRK